MQSAPQGSAGQACDAPATAHPSILQLSNPFGVHQGREDEKRAAAAQTEERLSARNG